MGNITNNLPGVLRSSTWYNYEYTTLYIYLLEGYTIISNKIPWGIKYSISSREEFKDTCKKKIGKFIQ